MDISLLALVAGLLAALGVGLLASWLLLGLGGLWERVIKLYRPRWRGLRKSLRGSRALDAFFAGERSGEDGDARSDSAGGALDALTWLPGLAALVLAIWMRDALLSPYLVALGVGLTWFIRARKARKAQSAMADQVRALVVLFRSRFAVGQSPFAVLTEIEGDLPAGVVRDAARRVTNIYGSSGRVDRALAPLRELNNPYLARLTMVLEMGGTASADAVTAEVRRIEADIKARDRLAGQAKASLALLKGTTRFLQAVNVAAIAVAVVLPAWRDFFTSTLQRRGTFLAATLFVALASFYFHQEIGMQEEKVL